MSRSDIRPELSGLVGLNPFYMHNSSARLEMFCSHVGQSLHVAGATNKFLQSGIERELGKYMFNIKMPCNANIIAVIEKYPRTLDAGSIPFNPLTIVVFENLDSPNNEIDILEIPLFCSMHQHYGFQYEFKEAFYELAPGASVAMDTVLADSPLITRSGDYKYGIEANIAMMSVPQVAEDGIVISESFSRKLTTRGFGKREASFGKTHYPINLEGYGSPDDPRPFPDIGDIIRPDGMVFCLREHNDLLAPVEMTRRAMSRPIYNYDKPTYVEPDAQGVARVIDVTVYKGQRPKSNIPYGLPFHAEKYYNRAQVFYKEILKVYNALKSNNRLENRISPCFQRLIVEAMAMTQAGVGIGSQNSANNTKITPVYKRTPLDEWRVEIVYMYDLPARIASKLTDSHGSKGVVVDIWPDERMPVDKFGKRADMITADLSTVNRMNAGRWFEQFFNAVGQYITTIELPQLLGNRTEAEVEAAWACWENYTMTISPPHFEAIVASGTIHRKLEHLEIVIRDGHHLHVPTDNGVFYPEAVAKLNQRYNHIIGPVDYIDYSGKKIRTKGNVLIGSMHILLLEKTGGTWSSVSSSKLSHFGNPSKLNDTDKYATPGKQQPIRLLGEAEVRLAVGVMGGEAIADIHDQSHNPQVHKLVVRNILRNPKPFQVKRIVDRAVHPIGAGKIHSMINHMLYCSGVKFIKEKKEQPWEC